MFLKSLLSFLSLSIYSFSLHFSCGKKLDLGPLHFMFMSFIFYIEFVIIAQGSVSDTNDFTLSNSRTPLCLYIYLFIFNWSIIAIQYCEDIQMANMK